MTLVAYGLIRAPTVVGASSLRVKYRSGSCNADIVTSKY